MENTITKYEVFGPFEVPRKKTTGGKLVLTFASDALADFWSDIESTRFGLSLGVGCYLFAVRAARGIKPWYVGQTKNAFKKECFTDNKKNIYRDVMENRQSGTPLIFLVARTTPKGKLSKSVSEREAGFVEQKLMHAAIATNAKLYNIHNTTFVKTLIIPGILNSPKGKPTTAVESFKLTLNTA